MYLMAQMTLVVIWAYSATSSSSLSLALVQCWEGMGHGLGDWVPLFQNATKKENDLLVEKNKSTIKTYLGPKQ